MPEEDLRWRGEFENGELNVLHGEAFGHPVLPIDWTGQVRAHSLGWVTARNGAKLVGFVDVAWDGGVHAFILDTMVTAASERRALARVSSWRPRPKHVRLGVSGCTSTSTTTCGRSTSTPADSGRRPPA